MSHPPILISREHPFDFLSANFFGMSILTEQLHEVTHHVINVMYGSVYGDIGFDACDSCIRQQHQAATTALDVHSTHLATRTERPHGLVDRFAVHVTGPPTLGSTV